MNFNEDDRNKTIPVQHAIVECCIALHLPEGQRLATGASNGQTCRSTYLVSGRWQDSTLSQGDTTYRSRGIHLPGASASNITYPTGQDAPCETYNNHGLNLRAQAQQQDRLWGGNAASIDGAVSFGGTSQVWRQYNNFVHAPNQTGGAAVTTYAPIKDDDTLETDGILRPDGTRMRFRFIGWNPSGTPDPTYSYSGNYVPSGTFEVGSAAFGAADPTLVWPIDYLGRICGPNRAVGASDRSDYVFNLEVASN